MDTALCRHQSEKRHQLSRRIKPAHIADFGGKGHSDQERGPAWWWEQRLDQRPASLSCRLQSAAHRADTSAE
jgi:hypothetical protein